MEKWLCRRGGAFEWICCPHRIGVSHVELPLCHERLYCESVLSRTLLASSGQRYGLCVGDGEVVCW